jgi:hypothetical protein
LPSLLNFLPTANFEGSLNVLLQLPIPELNSILIVEAEAYCRQPAGTLNPGTGPRWDPWPYICSMSKPLLCFVFPFVDPPY